MSSGVVHPFGERQRGPEAADLPMRIAVREGKSERSIRMTLSLAFISPILTESAIEGRLPRGFCVKRLTDLPMLWSEQWRDLGLQEPVQAGTELGRSIPLRSARR